MAEKMPQSLGKLFNKLSLELASASTDEFDGSVQSFIGQLGLHFGADRSYLLLIDDATQTLSVTHEFCPPGITPQKEAIQNVPMARFPWLAAQLAAMTVVSVPEVEELAAEAAEEQSEFRRQDIRSLVLVGLKLDGEVVGAFGFDFLSRSVSPGEPERQFLGQLAAILGSSVHRQLLSVRNQQFEHSLFRYSEQFPGVIFQFRVYPSGRMTFPFISRKVEEMFGLSQASVKPDATPLLECIVPEHQAAVFSGIDQSWQTLTPFEVQFQAIKGNGETAWIEARSVPAELADKSVVWHGYFYDITQKKMAESEIEQLAFYDPLTGLPNRRLLRDRLAQALAGSKRQGNSGALVFIDLDNFKTINDSAGHVVGDELLVQVGQRLQNSVREWDTVARIGGDEFVLVLKGFPSDPAKAAARVEKVCEKIRDALNEPYNLHGVEYNGSPSIGITLFHDHDAPLEELLSQADMAMFRAKEDGRNCIRFYDGTMQKKVSERLALESDLRAAIRGNQFSVHYQLQVDEDGNSVGAEALLRWQCPGRGMVSPSEFIPLAEESGLIGQLGYWVLEDVLFQIANWQLRGDLLSELPIAVNVSAKQFHLPSFCSTVMEILRKTGASPRNLKIEITESALAYDLTIVEETLRTLRSMGVRVSLDDFGTGYSSLGYLKRLSLDELKIDQGFVRDILDDPNDAAIAETILALASALRLSAVAEGVETERQRERLLQMGCKRFQGYLFSRPLPVSAFEALIEQSAFRRSPR